MGIYIRDLKMPKSCGSCPYNYSSCYCFITKSEIDRDFEYRERLADCPITDVEPHGRLIDADALSNLFKSKAKNDVSGLMVLMAANCIDNAPTVIEAEDK